MIVPLVHLLMVSMVMAKVTNITTDQNALLALKAHITPDPANLSNNWTTSTSVCNWIGVTCSTVHHQRVISLDLSHMNLSGTIPPHLGNMSFLANLTISNNSFHGSLPDELAHLRRLKYIDFRYNNFNIEIPLWFGYLPELQYMTLSGNKFVGSIPPSLGNISSLIALDLGENQLSGKIPSSFFNLSLLKLLDLSGNQLSGSFPSIILNMSSLIGVDLSTNRLSGGVPAYICSCLPRLEWLLLSINMFEAEIPSSLPKCRKLRYLSLAYNHFTGAIPKDIGNMTELKGIDLSYNQLRGGFPSELASLTKLEGLYIDNNALSGPIPSHISNLSSLQRMYASSNFLTGEVPYEIGTLHNLEVLKLEENNLVGFLPATIFNISTMKRLSLVDNKLSGSLPLSIKFGLPNLERLYLGINNFSGTIPNSITNISKLSILDVSSNLFSGSIPQTFGNLKSLEILNLANNYLTSPTSDLSFLSSLADCKNLRELELRNNPFNGILLSSIGNLSSTLEKFSMEDCGISGSIPKEIGNLSNLIVLHLGGNEVTGSIAGAFGGLQNLQGLYVDDNKLEGYIPDDICQISRLAYLFLDYNKLSGSIPACLGNLITLRAISLSSNMLTSIPSTLWNLVDILELDLSSNFLNGSLSIDIKKLKVVTSINLSGNNLSGGISTIAGELKSLQFLDLSYNRLEGTIPESFGGLTSLEVLDLSNNNIFGTIPMSLEELLYLKYLNLSFNQLEGEIPMRGPFTNFSVESFMGNVALCGSSRFQVPPCKTSGTRKKSRTKTTLVLIILPSSIALTIIIIALILVLMRCQRKIIKLPNEVNTSPQPTWKRFSYQELQQATSGFNESNLLGIGSFGSVYKGRLQDGFEIAIKVFHLQFEKALETFDAECEILRRIRHRNLVKIISSCSNLDFKALVLEYMPNGSLEQCLYSNNYFLDISQRLNIMIDVALAVEYLHFGYSTHIVHCDLKPNNVLLDQNMVAHLSDFGIARLLSDEKSMVQTQTLATIGYMAPEYGSEGKVSRKGDVYSYGIMLMETFTRKKPTDEIFDGEISLRHWVGDALNSSIIEVVDTNLLRRKDIHFSLKEQCVSSIFNLAMDCTRDLPEERIDMKNVVRELEKIRALLLASVERM